MGSQYYSTNGPNDQTRTADSDAPAFNPQSNDGSTSDSSGNGNSQGSGNSQGNGKPITIGNGNSNKGDNSSANGSKSGASKPNGFQSFFPRPSLNAGKVTTNSNNQTAQNNSQQSASQTSRTRSDAADNAEASSNTGLRSLQQRLSAVRKPQSTPTTAPEMHPTVAAPQALATDKFEPAPSSTLTPETTVTPFAASALSSVKAGGEGAPEGPSTPNMPSIRTAQVPSSIATGHDTIGDIPSTNNSSLPSASVVSPMKVSDPTFSSGTSSGVSTVGPVAGSPVVGGPVVGGPVVGGPIVSGPVSGSRRVQSAPVVSGTVLQGSSATSSGFGSGSSTSSTASASDTLPTPKVSEAAGDADSHLTSVTRKSVSSADNLIFAGQSPLLGVGTSGPRSITVGKEASYSVTITNAGEVAAQDVVVSVKIPQWTEIVGTKASSGAAESLSEQRGEPLMWRLPRLEARSKEQLIIRLIPRESRPFELATQWACSPVASQAMVEVKEPKLAIALDGPSEVLYGQTKVYRLSISNPGNGDAENVVLMLAPVDGGSGAPTRHEVGVIHAGESKPVEVELTARQAGTLSIKAHVGADGNLKAEVAQEIMVRRAGLKLAVSAPEMKFAGTATTYSVVVANPGNATAENISVAAILPPGAKFISSPGGQYMAQENKVVWSIPSLRPAAEQELELRCALNAPGANRMQLLSTAASDLSDSTAASTNVEALADLKLEVIDPPGPLAIGEEMVYEVHIRNRGTKAAENVDVAGFFSQGVEPISAQGAQNDVGSGQVVFHPINSIPAGTEVVLKIKARADLAGTHVFRAEVSCPSVGAKLASEETTMFYGDGRNAARTAARPSSGPGSAPTTGGETSPATLR
jgi:uncharacterized repeat protein (TIGR01451 family)